MGPLDIFDCSGVLALGYRLFSKEKQALGIDEALWQQGVSEPSAPQKGPKSQKIIKESFWGSAKKRHRLVLRRFFFAISGPEGLETPENGRSGHKGCVTNEGGGTSQSFGDVRFICPGASRCKRT